MSLSEPKPLPAPCQEKLWRAMCLKTQKGKAFTLLDVVVLAGTGLYYAKRYLRFTIREGLVVRVGNRSKQALYRVAAGQERSPAPRWNRREEKRIRCAGKNACATGVRGQGPGKDKGFNSLKQILGDMEAVLIAISGEAMILKGFLLEMRAAVEAAAGGGHGATGGDQ